MAPPVHGHLLVHAVVPQPSYLRHHAAVGDPVRRSGIGDFLNRLLAHPEVCGPGRVTLTAKRTERRDWFAAPLFTLTWVPRQVSAAWIPEPGETVEALSERLGVAVSSEAYDDLRRATEGMLPDARLPFPVLAAAGWQWGLMPFPDGFELGEDRYAAVRDNTHVLSQSWAVSVYEKGAAYMPRQEDPFLCQGMLKMCSTDLDVYLLVALDGLRVRSLSTSLARVAQELRVATTSSEAGGSRLVSGAYEDLIRRAIALDADAVAFLASEWWTDITSHRQADTILAWMLEVGWLDDAVAQVVEQSRLLRESVQTLIEREEHLLDQQRQNSTRVMARALALLAFVGIPLTVLLEIWINWSGLPISQRGGAWWLSLFGVLGGAGAFGLLLARLFRIRLWQYPGSKVGRGEDRPRLGDGETPRRTLGWRQK